MTRKEFWIRFCLWVLFAAVIPVTYIAVRYGIFSAKDEPYRLTGWGVIAIIVVGVFMTSLAKEVVVGMPKGSMVRQCVSGFLKIMPLFLFVFVIHAIKESIDAFESFLVVLVTCEAIAVPLNPMPKWSTMNGVDLDEESFFRALSSALFGKKEDKK